MFNNQLSLRRFALMIFIIGGVLTISAQHVYVVPKNKKKKTETTKSQFTVKKSASVTETGKSVEKELKLVDDSLKNLQSSLNAISQEVKSISDSLKKVQKSVPTDSWFKCNHIADNLTASFTLGTTGLGLEISTPVTKWTSLRMGVEGIPQFRVPLDFTISSYVDGQVSDNFDRIQDFMLQITGEEMKEKVTMNCRPKMIDFKMLVDVYPFQTNRHWHLTAGFYIGSHTLGSAINSKDATKSLIAMNIYNRFYDRMEKFDYQEEPFYGDVYLTKEAYEEFMGFGRLGIHLGNRKDGTPYYLTPKANATVTAKAYTQVFKPYLGFGYSGAIDCEKRWNVGFEAGALFWGGAPQVVVNDEVNLNKDLTRVRGRVGDYLKIIKALPVYPVVNFKISYTFF